jgi:hypothetical protein
MEEILQLGCCTRLEGDLAERGNALISAAGNVGIEALGEMGGFGALSGRAEVFHH